MGFDPIRLELVRNAVGSIADEMVLTVVRIAYSSIMKDTMDLSSAICDRHGRLIAQGLSLPLHLGSIPDAMAAVQAELGEGLAPGDVVILNDPYHGGMHLPDIFMVKPVFLGEHRLGYAVVVAHHNDVGGRVPGSSAADSTEIFQEGLRIPVVKLYRRGVPDETLLRLIALNVRTPDVVLGDLQAQLAGCQIAERGLAALVERYGVPGLEAAFEALLDYSERGARRTIAAIPDGTYRFVDHLEDDGVDLDRPVRIEVAVHVAGDELTVDFTGTSGQVRGAINSTLSFTRSAVYFAVRAIMDAEVPNNAGFFRPIHVVAPPRSLVNAGPPAACAARGVTGFRVMDALFGALAQAVPERVRAAGEGGTTSYSFGGYDAAGRFVHFREAVMGNWGGGFGREGLDGVANPAANISNAPAEVVEHQAPIRVERYELVPDSGGPGRWRGGLAVVRQLRFLGEQATLQLRSDRRRHPPYGLCGGGPGAPSQTHLETEAGWRLLPTKFTIAIVRGQALRHVTAGAGGYGDPLERDPTRVLEDVRNGKVTHAAAERDYGVRVVGPPWRLDAAGTAALRAARQAARAAPTDPAGPGAAGRAGGDGLAGTAGGVARTPSAVPGQGPRTGTAAAAPGAPGPGKLPAAERPALPGARGSAAPRGTPPAGSGGADRAGPAPRASRGRPGLEVRAATGGAAAAAIPPPAGPGPAPATAADAPARRRAGVRGVAAGGGPGRGGRAAGEAARDQDAGSRPATPRAGRGRGRPVPRRPSRPAGEGPRGA